MESTRDIPCQICQEKTAIYTCPRCSIRTCSAVCSKSHKSIQSCSGEREKTAYVPMNKYGWGTMANDYAYLEEVGRKSSEWGLEIVKGGYFANAISSRGRGRGRGTKRFQSGGRAKRDLLKTQLAARDIDMDMLPTGMERRKLNQSTCDKKTKQPLLTIEFILHPPRYALPSSSESTLQPFTLLTHRNLLSSTPIDVLRRYIQTHTKKDALPQWIHPLFDSFKEGEPPSLTYLLEQPSESAQNPITKIHYKLHPFAPLSSNLRDRSFVEYPTIDVWEDGDFTGPIIEPNGTYMDGEEARPTKRRRLETTQKMQNASLLQGYDSSENDDEDEGKGLGILGTYGSEEEQDQEKLEADLTDNAEDSQGEDYTSTGDAKEDVREIFEAVGELLSPQHVEDWSDDREDAGPGWEESGDEEEQFARALERTKRHPSSSHAINVPPT